VGNNEIGDNKNEGELLAIPTAMVMGDAPVRRGAHCPIEHIPGFTGSHWMPSLGKCLSRITPAAAMVINIVESKQNKTKQTITKHIF